jgi:hypothetical protein
MFAPLISKSATSTFAKSTQESTPAQVRSKPNPDRAHGTGAAWTFSDIQTQAPRRTGSAETAHSTGVPLDHSTRRFFERGFKSDLSDVRVHTNQAAQTSTAAEQAIAYTSGKNIHFGAGHYQPNTPQGRWVLGHELAHVLQQRGGGPRTDANEGNLEGEANKAAMQVVIGGSAHVSASHGAPSKQFLRVSSGGFGAALEDYTNLWHVDNKAVRLLQQSPTFMHLAHALDRHYVAPHDPAFKNVGIGGWELGPDGKMVRPASVAGKRALFVVDGEPEFETFSVPTNNLSGDVISIKSNDIPTFITDIAHESTHAAAFVGAAAPQPQTLVQEIDAGLQDEIDTRQSEAKIDSEIPDKAVKAKAALVGSTVKKEVERDIVPAQNLTYLEMFFFGRELSDAQKAEGLSDDETRDLREKMAKDPNNPPFEMGKKLVNGIFNLSSYAEAWFDHQTAVKEWIDFAKNNQPNDPTYDVDKEALLQDHAKRFFKGKVAYH